MRRHQKSMPSRAKEFPGTDQDSRLLHTIYPNGSRLSNLFPVFINYSPSPKTGDQDLSGLKRSIF
jgi:hypothetical protein